MSVDHAVVDERLIDARAVAREVGAVAVGLLAADGAQDHAAVLGVGGRIESAKGPVFAAYFAGSRERFDAQPNYQNGLYVLVDGAVYSVRGERVSTAIRRGITTREFTLSRGDRPQRSVEYRWPVFRGNSGDFLSTLSEMVRTYG